MCGAGGSREYGRSVPHASLRSPGPRHPTGPMQRIMQRRRCIALHRDVPICGTGPAAPQVRRPFCVRGCSQIPTRAAGSIPVARSKDQRKRRRNLASSTAIPVPRVNADPAWRGVPARRSAVRYSTRATRRRGSAGMLEWLKDGLTIADSGFAVLGGLVAAAEYSVKPLRRRWKRRPSQVQRQQAEQLDQLGLGRPLQTIETVLGSPHLLNRWNTPDGESEERNTGCQAPGWYCRHLRAQWRLTQSPLPTRSCTTTPRRSRVG